MIPLMKHAFLEEEQTKRALADFILHAPRLSMDAKCREFELSFAAHQKTNDAILFSSGGGANLAMLQALKNLGRLKDGDKVGFSAVTWSTNPMPIIQLGLQPVPIDCDPTTLNVMSGNLLTCLEQNPLNAVFLTNALGFAGDLSRIREVCEERGILLLEDNCESLGTRIDGDLTGNFGVCASFSFYVAHHMSTIEGGMVCTRDEELGEMLRLVRANGWDRNLSDAQKAKWRSRYRVETAFEAAYVFYDLGYNLRPTEITGFIGLAQLGFLDEAIKKREDNYLRLEAVARSNPDFLIPARGHIELLSNFAFPVICKTPALRSRYVQRFQSANIEVRPLIAGNIQRQPFFAKYVRQTYPTPGADFLHTSAFYCGNYPELTKRDLETIGGCLKPESRRP
jgi:CDP-4-dehydro-6-deoxyglucose reductase, E1